METWLKKSLEGHESPIPIGGWKGLHQTRKKKNRKPFYWFLAASLVLFAALGIWNSTNMKHFTADQTDGPETKATKSTERSISEPGSKGSNEQEKTSIPASGSSKEAQEMQEPLDPTENPVGEVSEANYSTPNERNDLPVPVVSSIVVRKIGNRNVAPFAYSPMNVALPVRDALLPRRMKRISFFVEASAFMGNLSFASEASLATYNPAYSSCIKTHKLRYLEQSLGFGAYYHGLRRWSIGSGLSLSHNTASGEVNYAYYESQRNLVNLGTQGWPLYAIDQSENLDHPTTLTSWNIQVPLRIRYQPFADFGPVLEIGANYAYNLKNQGDWVNPETLTVERSTSLVPKHRFSAEVALGYQWDLKRTRILLNYRFSPWSTKYAPIQGRLGAPMHGIGIQLQMPH